ncbi:hypothetical protein CFC21_105056 [Triticum aestivum]|uniref:Peptidase A1 domain-containing protein n=2 Tax=Triticum aestivum TaxID=4565 RepID=A0A341YJJ6_WHEAT|nr:aspartic proteinase nepenthesin-2-like [Triticum aestivum]XP_044435523.1 aspartic proteinase nepenthesin-2-like [Triticum aestivum]XP_044435617.1 aspartic proteinase nepenthesin-2-like [Triticum aestivum]KAF7104132.1 hypothetical protein CFC21_105056 [Triticum aestivum]
MAPKSILALALLVVLVPFSHGVTALVSSSPPFNGSGGGGFSLRLIANHQPTHYDLASLQRAKEQVKCRIKHQILPNEIRPFMCPLQEMMYAVMVGIGTGAGFQNYQLALDMAGGLSWMQCLPCQPCLPQLTPVFDPTKSPTYSTVPAHNTLWCRPPYQALPNGACGFRIEYRDATGASGYLARDTFSLPTGNNQFVPLEGIVFGCAHHTEHFHNQDTVAGILSLGMGPVGKPPTAFTKQVLPHHGGRFSKFSYCPFKPGTSLYSYLRFGNDIPSRPPAGVHRQSTPVLAPAENREAYFVKLAGITIGVNRLRSVTPDMFRRTAHGTGGCVIDIGTKMTSFVHAAYVHIEQAVRQHLEHHGAHIVVVRGHKCVQHPAAHVLPSMTLHFENGAWLRILPEHVFMPLVVSGHHYQCLGFVSSTDLTVIGARQQVNHRFIFDLHDTIPIMSFNAEDCHLEGA